MTLLLFVILGAFACLGPAGNCPALASRPEWSLSLRLTRSGKRIEIDQEFNFYSMVDFTEIPRGVQGRRSARPPGGGGPRRPPPRPRRSDDRPAPL